MKKIEALFLLGFLVITVLSAQEFAPVGSKWYYTEEFSFSGDISYLQIESVGDTVIHGKNCHILENNGGLDCAYNSNKDYLYSEDSIVYFYVNEIDTFQVLYNFKAVKGDTWLTVFNCFDGLDTLKATVDSVFFVKINGYTLKRQWLTYSEPVPNSGQSYHATVTDKLGDSYFLFNLYSLSVACDGNYSDGLRCYEDPNFGFYSTDIADSCTYTYDWTSIAEIPKALDIQIYPNPTTGCVEIESELKKECTFTLYDVTGDILLVDNNKGDSRLDLSSLDKGVYFLKIISDGKILGMRKIIKN